ncbi:MAG: 16S rRNA (cytosine(1402)-N(4))-methyltransferase RsmH [Chloroflexi bacterium]|nr:16S rRNA (cytosine(1402)-N(4))-methyltransferase RsmH [Chloroflexota bacterium]
MAMPVHIPVLLNETLEALAVRPGGRYIDCTVGGGGHAVTILERSLPGGRLLGIDADPEAMKAAQVRLAAYRNSVTLVNDNFVNLQAIAYRHDFVSAHGILFDLGLSSLQLEHEGRGFSFQQDAPLDMRFDPRQKLTAADIVNTYSEEELARLIWVYGEDVLSRRIARQIVRARPLMTTSQLVRAVEAAAGHRRTRIHPATRTFQALRIAVNRELENLELALTQVPRVLGSGGRLVVISYHSLEDRIVKQFMQREARDCICPPGTPVCVCGHKASIRLVNRKVITPSAAEIQTNPRSRSARLRAAERITTGAEQFEIAQRPSSMEAGDNGWRQPCQFNKRQEVFLTAG